MRTKFPALTIILFAILCMFARCASSSVDCDYTVRTLAEREKSGARDTIGTAGVFAFFTDTLGWRVSSYEDAVAGTITHTDGRTKQYDVRGEQYSTGIFNFHFTTAPVMLVTYHSELPAYGWRDSNVTENLPEMNITAVFQTHLFGTEYNPLRRNTTVTGAGWTMVYEGDGAEPVDTDTPEASTVTELPYAIGFEKEGENANDSFSASSSYTSTLRFDGKEDYKWGMFYSTVSTANKISGNQSLSMRWTTSNVGEWARTSTNFTVANLKRMTFYSRYAYDEGRSSTMNLLVLHSTDGGTTWQGGRTYTLSETVQQYTYDVSAAGADARIRFTLAIPEPAPTQTAYVIIDDVVFE